MDPISTLVPRPLAVLGARSVVVLTKRVVAFSGAGSFAALRALMAARAAASRASNAARFCSSLLAWMWSSTVGPSVPLGARPSRPPPLAASRNAWSASETACDRSSGLAHIARASPSVAEAPVCCRRLESPRCAIP